MDWTELDILYNVLGTFYLLGLHRTLTSVPAAHSLKWVLPHFLSNGNQNNANDKHHESKRQHDRAQDVGVCPWYSSEVEASEDQATEQHAAPGADQQDGIAVEVKGTTSSSSVPRKAEHRAIGVWTELLRSERERERMSNGERVLSQSDELQRWRRWRHGQ